MRKALLCTFAALLFSLSTVQTAAAVSYIGSDSWNVTFTEDKRMSSTFLTSALDEVISDMQPGDDVTITVHLENKYEESVRWFLRNAVLYSLEDRSANPAIGGGAYIYRLEYISPDGGTSVLYSADTTGTDLRADPGNGLRDAVPATASYIELGLMDSGQSGVVLLSVMLDGETHDNEYQDTMADMQMSFAVDIPSAETPEPTGSPPSTEPPETPAPTEPTRPTSTPTTEISTRIIGKTGDSLRPLAYFSAMIVCGILALLLGLWSRKLRGRNMGGDTREE